MNKILNISNNIYVKKNNYTGNDFLRVRTSMVFEIRLCLIIVIIRKMYMLTFFN